MCLLAQTLVWQAWSAVLCFAKLNLWYHHVIGALASPLRLALAYLVGATSPRCGRALRQGVDLVMSGQDLAGAPAVDLHYLELLAQSYPNKVAAFSEIINLQAILNLPKGTEHFVSDLHGEYEAFCHILNSCSGVIHDKVDELFADMPKSEKAELCALIYYPEEVMKLTEQQGQLNDAWYQNKLTSLITLCKYLSSKYTRSKVRKAINQNYSYIIDELLHAQEGESNSRAQYHAAIIATILRTKAAPHFLISLCALAKRLAVDHLHVVGDVYDRGSHPDKIMALLMDYHSIDLQWGNHDILWMGAALGSEACIATVLRNNINYFNCSLLESAYGISLRQLNDFAQKTYTSPAKPHEETVPRHVCSAFALQGATGDLNDEHAYELMMHAYADDNRAKMVKAITVIALKLQGQLIKRNPEFAMDDRLLLDKIDLKRGTVKIGATEYQLNTTDLPTIDPADPFALSRDEAYIVKRLKESFLQSRQLQREVAFLFSHGSIYKIFNGNLLYHGCIPMTKTGEFRKVNCHGQELSGRAYLDYCEKVARQAYYQRDERSLDFMYFMWCGLLSPLAGRVMKPFERYFIDDKSTHQEPRDPYYEYYYREEVCRMILREFGVDEEKGHIINGHTPIKVREGESPVRGNGKLFVIDGGLCQAYHKTTGIAGYTLICSSHGMVLKAHRAFDSIHKAIYEHIDLESEATEVEHYQNRLKVASTDNGRKIKRTIAELEALLHAYQNGLIPER